MTDNDWQPPLAANLMLCTNRCTIPYHPLPNTNMPAYPSYGPNHLLTP